MDLNFEFDDSSLAAKLCGVKDSNIKEIENRFNISNYTARTDLKTLVDLGFLEVIQVNKKKQNFIKSKNFEDILHQQKI